MIFYLFDMILPDQKYGSGFREVQWEQTWNLESRKWTVSSDTVASRLHLLEHRP